jgi:hypothetical protein
MKQRKLSASVAAGADPHAVQRKGGGERWRQPFIIIKFHALQTRQRAYRVERSRRSRMQDERGFPGMIIIGQRFVAGN